MHRWPAHAHRLRIAFLALNSDGDQASNPNPGRPPPAELALPTAAMSSRAPVELDFLGLCAADHHRDGGKTTTSFSSIGGMKTSAIASIGTQQLRRVIAAAEPPTPTKPPAPTMTLFYNGAVATFDVSQDKAETIIRMAAEASNDKGRSRGNAFVGNFAKDMPLTRTRSLQQFLQKRKERLTRLGPYQLDLGGTGGVGAASKSFHVKEEAA